MADGPAPRPRLALAIPTYRRAEILSRNLEQMDEDLRRLGVAVYVSDDSPDDETERALARFDFVRYRRNDPPLRHDANLVATLTWPDADYVWLLGDSHAIDRLSPVLAFLDDQDLLLVNSHATDRQNILAAHGEDARALLLRMLWHQTLTGATIYHKRVCDWVQTQKDNLVVMRNFPQLSMILGYVSSHPASIGWYGKPSLVSAKKESYWAAQAIPVFVDDWVALVEAFPQVIAPAEKAAVLRSHSSRLRFFNIFMLLDLRSAGAFTWRRLLQKRFRAAMHLSLPVLAAILLVPKALRSPLRKGLAALKQRRAAWRNRLHVGAPS